MTLIWKSGLLKKTASVLAALALFSITTSPLFAAPQRPVQTSTLRKVTMDAFKSLRPKIAAIKDDNRTGTHIKRILALIDAFEQTDTVKKRDALAALGVTIRNRAIDKNTIATFSSRDGAEKLIWTRPSPASYPVLPERSMQPDGGSSAPRFDDPQNLEEAEEYAAEQWAAADALESELSAAYDDGLNWLSTHGDEPCASDQQVEAPDGGTAAAPRFDCVEKAWTALVSVASGILSAQSVKDAVAGAIGTLRSLISSYQAAYAAGSISATAMENMIGGALIDFVASINI